MRQKKPVSEDTLCEDIQDSEKDSLQINAQPKRQCTSRDGTINKLVFFPSGKSYVSPWIYSHREQRENSNGRSRNRRKEPSSLCVLVHRRPLCVETNMVNHSQIGDTRDGQPDPAHTTVACKRAEETRGKHDQVGNDGHQEVCAWEAGDQGEVGEQERCCECPVHVAQPEDLSDVVCVGVWDMLV
jgi:hypothetical protein